MLYLVFQLKSHSYLYQSMPQEKIDEESHPGVLHEVFETSSSSSDSSSTDSGDTDTTSGSHTTARRIRRAFRHRKRRKSSGTTESIPSVPSHIPSPPIESSSVIENSPQPGTSRRASFLDIIMSGDEGDTEAGMQSRLQGISKVRDFEQSAEAVRSPERVSSPDSHKFRFRKRKQKKHKKKKAAKTTDPEKAETKRAELLSPDEQNAIHRVGFVEQTPELIAPGTPGSAAAKSRAALLRERPGLPKLFSQNVFVDPLPRTPSQPAKDRRASSLPDLTRARTVPGRGYHPSVIARAPLKKVRTEDESSSDEDEGEYEMSRTAAVVMLLASTGLVAICAEFLVDAIPNMTDNSSVSQAFIGLIILPIVGNAAEHVTAVTVATKNKMDLAIGVAVGSSIQIALFVTPLVVLLGWIMGRSMSLYFTLFETISLFVTAFVVNFLVLDGKSNYLEGTLLIAAYIIIAVAAFFYPDSASASELGGSESANATTTARMMMAMMLRA
jgi:Ca2+:H+ antiporter